MWYNAFRKGVVVLKKCPRCGMIVDEKNECPICYETITYESTVMVEKEKFIYNRFYFKYLVRNSWFSVTCLLIGLLVLIILQPPMIPFIYAGIFFLVLSVVYSLFERQFFCLWKRHALEAGWKVVREYEKEKSPYYKYYWSVFGLFLVFVFSIFIQ